MFISLDGHSAWNSFGKPSDGTLYKKEIFETISLDRIIEIHRNEINKIDLIKIDVEGWEIPVLEGGVGVLGVEDAPVLMVEFTEVNAKNAGYSCAELYKLGEQYDYKWYEYNSKNKKLTWSPLKSDYPYKNLIAIKNLEDVKKRLS